MLVIKGGVGLTEQQFHQLRFDICENVRLHTQQPQIKQLLELDLYPDVEITEKGDHLKIEGFLRLKGAYYGETSDEAEVYDGKKREELSYLIPVEITLPSDRAQLKHISAEIESFDYQVLSPFELQIDAILLIDGLMPEKEEAEEITEQHVPMFSGSEAIHEVEEQATQSEDQQHKKVEVSGQEKQVDESASRPGNKDRSHLAAEVPEVEEPQQVDEEDVKQEGSGQQELAEEGEHVTDEALADEPEETGDDWAKWLLKEKEENFTSMRMVIVQEHDSVKKLAERYEISPSRIRQVNGLDDRELEKGEIVYIPNCHSERASSQD